MKSSKKTLNKLVKFVVDSYFILVFLACIGFVGIVSLYKLFVVKPTFVNVKVKMGDGLWYANSLKPSSWFIDSLKRGEMEKGLTGNPIAKILEIRYYPSWGSDQYDIYLTIKLQVTGNDKTKKFTFRRSTIGVGAPIDFEFPSVQFSGTIVELSNFPLKNKCQEKTIELIKTLSFPWEYEAIQVGDKYFDGEDYIFEIIDKQSQGFSPLLSYGSNSVDSTFFANGKSILLKAKIKVKKINNNLILGEDQIIRLGKVINITTNNLTLNNYEVIKIE